jgi:UDP-GlcNAc:undecaprenyl-phosphate GlcNAc-1-phosphate transferase
MLAQLPSNSYSADDVVAPYVYVFYVSFGLAFVLTPVMRAVAMYYGIIDHPDKIRKMHKAPVAYLGGVAVFVAWLGGLAISELLHLHRIDPGWPTDAAGIAHPIIRFGVVVGGLLIALLGLWDDVYKLEPWMKIAGQVSAATFLLWDGIGLDLMRPVVTPVMSMINVVLGGSTVGPPPEAIVTILSSILVIVLVVGCCNATNLMDGLDGLCGGVTAVISAGFLFVAVHLAMFGAPFQTNIDAQRVILAIALLGAVLGFIPYNFNPASIFMGDTGSMFLGFVCSTMIIMMGMGHLKWFLASMVIFALPILDTILAFARRWTNGRPLFSADKQHFHHQLVARGFSVKQTVLISYALAVFFGLLGVSMVYMRTRYTIAIYLVVFGSIMVTAYKLGMIHERPPTGGAGNLGEVSADAFEPEFDEGSVMELPDKRHEGLDRSELEMAAHVRASEASDKRNGDSGSAGRPI